MSTLEEIKERALTIYVGATVPQERLLKVIAGDVPKLIAALEAVEALHRPIKKWEPYAEAGYTFATYEEALRAAGEEDLGLMAIQGGPQFFEVCAECGRIESEQLAEIGEEWGYRESLWPCPTHLNMQGALQ